ncbi:MAG: hypothetical protein AAFP13_02065 [Pseudomonadota bacterium]
MGLMLLGLLLLGSGLAWFTRGAMSELAIAWTCAALYGCAALIAWIAHLTGGLTSAVLMSPWIESGTLSTELALEPGTNGLLFVALSLTLGTAAQVMVHDLPLTAGKSKAKPNEKARLSLLHGLLMSATVVFFTASGTVQALAALFFLAWFSAQLAGFDHRSQGAGRAMQRVLVVLVAGTCALAIGAAALFAARDGARFDVLFAEPLAGETTLFGQAVALEALTGGAVVIAAATLLGLYIAHIWHAESALTPAPTAALAPLVLALAGLWLLDVQGAGLGEGHRTFLGVFGAASAIALGVLSVLQQDIRRAAALLVGAAGGLVAVSVALDEIGLATAHLMAQGVCLALLLWGVSSLVARGGECDLWQLGGRKAAFGSHYGALIVGAVGLSGLGLPFPYEGLLIGLGGFASASALLTVTHGTAFFVPVVIALILTSFAVWRVVVMAFAGAPRSPVPEGVSEPPVTRSVLGVAALLVILSALWVPMQPVPESASWITTVPVICSAIGLALAALLFAMRPGWAKALARIIPDTGGALAEERLIGGYVARPLAWAGRTLGHRLDGAGLDALMTRLARALFPALTQAWSRLSGGRTTPYALTAIVGLVLLSTILAMVGA